MKLLSLTMVVLATAIVFPIPQARATEAVQTTCVARTAASLDALAKGDFDAARAHFAPKVAGKLDAAKLKQVWAQLQASAGDYRSHGTPSLKQLQGQALLVTPVTFASMSLDLLTKCDENNELAAYQMVPATKIALLASTAKTAPLKAHVQANGVRIKPMSVASPAGPLKGVLTVPAGDGPFPAVVLVAGSGPNDYDETIGPNKPLRDIAQGLAAAGVASLRYDKRTHDYPKHWGDESGEVVDAEVTVDALTAAHTLAKVDDVNPQRVFVLGHSLGAMLAPRIGQRDPQLAGLIMMAAPARSLLDVLVEQLREQGKRQGVTAAGTQKGLDAIADERKALAKASSSDEVPEGQFMGAAQSYWLSLADVHQVATAKALTMPLLIAQGGADFQVSPSKDFAQWKKALGEQRNVSFHLYPGLSHLFMPAGDTGTLADYTKPAHVDPQVIADIAAWIKAQKPATQP